MAFAWTLGPTAGSATMQHTSEASLIGNADFKGGASFNGGSGASQSRHASPSPAGPRRSFLMSGKKLALVAGLATLSWISTYAGMLELIQANMGDLDLIMQIAIGGSVAMLMLMIVWLLDQLFDENNAASIRIVYAAGYLFLTLISIGFSFGFYWKFLESRTEATRSAESAITQVQASLTTAETRLTQLQQSFEGLAAISTQKAADEVATGRSCPNSRPGDGPRRRLRESDSASLSLASDFVKDRAAVIRKDIAGLNDDIQKIVKQDASTFDPKTGTRNDFMRSVNRKLELTVSGFNSFRNDPQLRQFRTDFAERAEKSAFPDDNGKTFVCPDVQLQTGLRGGVKAIDSLPVLEKPEIATVEGAEATIEAFRRLFVTLTSLATFKLPATPDDIREQQAKAIQSLGAAAPAPIVSEQSAGLGKRDWVPLLIAVFVDICLLLVSIPPATSQAERTRRRRMSATGEGYRTIADLSAIHADEDTLKQLEPLRHIAFDHWGHDYVAVPMIAGTGAHIQKRQREPNGWVAYFFGNDEDAERADPVKLSKEDLWEAQFLANLFASHEHHGPYKRIFGRFVPVRAKLAQLGSKWQNIQTFRLYRFKRGAWSDFVLDVIVGADRALAPLREAQERARVAKVEIKRDVILNEAESRQLDHKSKLDEQRDIVNTRRKMRELSSEHEQLKLDIEREKLEKERNRLRNELARQFAVDAEQFENYVPAEDRDPDGILTRSRRERTQAPRTAAEPSPEVVALMQSVSQQALATQEIARQQTEALKEIGQGMARMLETLARNQGATNVDQQALDTGIQAVDPVRATGSGVHSFAAYAQRETTLDAARSAQREARPASEAPTVIPLHADRTEPKLEAGAPLGWTANGKSNDSPESRSPESRSPEFRGPDFDNPAPTFNGNAALRLKPVTEGSPRLPVFGYGLSRLLGRSGSDGSDHVHPGIRFEDAPIEPLVRDSIDVSGIYAGAPAADERANRDADFEDQNGASSPSQIDAFIEAVRYPAEPEQAETNGASHPNLETPAQDDDVGAFASRYASQRLSKRRVKSKG